MEPGEGREEWWYVGIVAQRAKAFADNVPGSFFVDRDCIDCETCYTMAPEVFEDAGNHSRVRRQPGTEVVVVEGAGHSIQGDKPLELAALVRKLIGS